MSRRWKNVIIKGRHRIHFHCMTLANTSESPPLTILVHSWFWTKGERLYSSYETFDITQKLPPSNDFCTLKTNRGHWAPCFNHLDFPVGPGMSAFAWGGGLHSLIKKKSPSVLIWNLQYVIKIEIEWRLPYVHHLDNAMLCTVWGTYM